MNDQAPLARRSNISGKPASGAQCHHARRPHLRPGIGRTAIRRSQCARIGQRLGRGETGADARARPAPERQILEAVASALPLRREAIGIERVGHRPTTCGGGGCIHGQIETMSPGSTSCSPSRSGRDRLAVEARAPADRGASSRSRTAAAAAAVREARHRSAPPTARPRPRRPASSCSSGCSASRNRVQLIALAVVS